MIVTSIPILFTDLVGSILMIVLSLLSLRLVFKLRRQDSDNLIWTYLWWICLALSCFAMSRSVGHILKNFLLMFGQKSVWDAIRPFSGAINTFMFVVVGAVTLFFERIWKVYQLIRKDREEIQSAHKELLYLNQNLERLVKERTNALSVSEYKYRRIFEVSKDMILVTNRDGGIVNLNPSGYSLLGLAGETEPIENRNVLEFIAEPVSWLSVMASVQRERSVSNVELDIRTSDGAVRRILLSGSMAEPSDNEEETIHFLIKDIEQRKLMEEQLAQADKLASIGELSSGVAHEINNPLGVILGYTQLLLRGEKNTSERFADLKTIEKHVRSCKSIVEDLLSFSRKSETEKERLDIHRVIEDVLTFVQHHSDIEHIAIEKDYSPGVPPILMDEKKIKQVLINLVVNAIHAVGQKGRIWVATVLNAQSDNLLVTVRDDGHGIEKKDINKIFDPFFTTKATGEGTGLGLSVSYGIIKDHGGQIDVESKPGAGTTFTFTLPVSPNKQET
jgi:two-component system, NtrC family, sensor kinase